MVSVELSSKKSQANFSHQNISLIELGRGLICASGLGLGLL